jgi:hypothetical protein
VGLEPFKEHVYAHHPRQDGRRGRLAACA